MGFSQRINAILNWTEPNRTELNWTELNRTELNRTEQNRTEGRTKSQQASQCVPYDRFNIDSEASSIDNMNIFVCGLIDDISLPVKNLRTI